MTKSHAQLKGGDTSPWNRENSWNERIDGNVRAVLRMIQLHNKGKLSFDDVYTGIRLNAESLQISPNELLGIVEEIHKENNPESESYIDDTILHLKETLETRSPEEE